MSFFFVLGGFTQHNFQLSFDAANLGFIPEREFIPENELILERSDANYAGMSMSSSLSSLSSESLLLLS